MSGGVGALLVIAARRMSAVGFELCRDVDCLRWRRLGGRGLAMRSAVTGYSDDFALRSKVPFADLEHQNFALIVAESLIEAGEHLLASSRIERTAEDAVLDMVEPIILADVGNSEPDAVARDVVDNKGQQFLSAH